MGDLIDRQAAIDALEREKTYSAVYKYGYTQTDYFKQYNMGLTDGIKALNKLPSAQPEQTNCEYCHEDSDGYVRSIEKNSHAWIVRRGRSMKLRIGLKGEYRECDILYCPMCGRRLAYG
jgi:hypothetical protein